MGGESDDKVWERLKEQAHGWGGTISVPNNLAKKAAKTLGEAEGRLTAIADRSNWLAFDPGAFGALPAPVGSNNLGNEFRAQGDKFPTILGKHRDTVRNIRTVFVLADARYKSGEAKSAQWFQRLEPAPKSVGDGLLAPGGSDGERSPAPTQTSANFTAGREGRPALGTLGGHHIEFSRAAIDYVDGGHLSWFELYTLGHTIDAGSVYKAAENWLWLQYEVRLVYFQLENSKYELFNGWTGVGERSGEKAAAAAFGRFQEDIDALRQSMEVMGVQLATAAGWLAATVPLMPQTGSPPIGFESEGLYQARANYNAHYLAGFLATKVPVLSEGAR
ncbi:hypothetical protein [Nocardia sp. NPDC052566]|uniref:hypothetical protein n=1 Tax=Nocardia sp. NPDC052566 TaxID=3364330 RepID=UPI0037CB3498